MKSIALIISYIAPVAVAHEASSSLHSAGYCQAPVLRSFPLLSSPTCSHDTLTTKYQAGNTRNPPNSAWTRASSCTGNGTEEYCVFVSSTFGNGRGLSVVTSPERAEYIANLPAFTNSLALERANKEPDPAQAPYAYVHVPGKDMGVVATRPIYRGDHLMTFTPALIVDYGAFENLAEGDTQRLQTEAIDHLPNDLRVKFLNLSTHDGASNHLERVDKILKTNAFDIEIGDANENGLYVVFPEISRFNHDCRPNANYWFDPTTLTHNIYATRQIAVGEEISLTYIDPLRIRAKRQKRLHRIWGFNCSCSLCTQRSDMTDASDARIKQIRQIRKQLEDYTTASSATPQMADLFVSMYEQERLDGSIYEAYAFAAIEWNGVGEPWNAVRYAQLAIEFGLASVGPKDKDVKELKRLVDDPWGHWSWMLRTSKRMSWGKMREVENNYMRGGEEDDDE